MKNITKLCKLLFIPMLIASCASLDKFKASEEMETDIVCNKQVKKFDSYSHEFNKVTYYFHSYDCREVFKMNPEKFILNQCNAKP